MHPLTQVTTFYSYKGGVGRTLLLANVGACLARGTMSQADNRARPRAPRKTLLVDLDAEAPGLHLVPGLTPKSPPRQGLFEWLRQLLERNITEPDERDYKTLAKSIAPCSALPEHLALLPAHGHDADFAELYEQIDWEDLFADTARAKALFGGILAHASTLGYEHILLDARTGLTDLGGLLAVALPHTTVLVGSYGHQSTAGLARIWRGMQAAADGKSESRRGEPLERLLVASPVPCDERELEARREAWRTAFAQMPTKRLREIPLHPELLVGERLFALSDDAHPLRAAYEDVAQCVDELRTKRLEALETARRARTQHPDSTIRHDDDDDPDAPFAPHCRDGRKAKGDRFEDRVAHVLRLRGFQVEREQLLGGNRVDLIASKGDVLSTQTFFVECKDHRADVPKETLEKLLGWVSGEEARRRAARGLCVARGFSPAALAFANDQKDRIQALTIDDLERSLVDFGRYLQDICLAHESTELFRTYVDQRVLDDASEGATQATTRETLLEHGRAWAAGRGRRFWLLLGDYGTGKSAFVRALAYDLAKAALADADAPIPLYINLKDYATTLSFATLVVDHLRPKLQGSVDPEVIRHLIRAGRVVLLLDSFDEMGIATEGRALERQLREFASLTVDAPLDARGSRVLLTCRTHFFKSQQMTKAVADGSVDVSGLATSLAPLGELAKSFDAAIDELALFDHDQIAAYLGKCLGSPAKAAAALEFIRNTHDLGNLAPRPVLLEMIWKSLPALTAQQNKGERITAAALYHRFANDWLKDRSGGQLRSSAEQRWLILERLAFRLWAEPQNRLHYEKLAQLVHDLPAGLRGGIDPLQLDLELRTAAFLTRTQDGFYGFSHKSFREFFLACGLLRAARECSAGERVAELLDTEALSPELAAFLVQLELGGGSGGESRGKHTAVAAALRAVLAAPYRARVSENALRLAYDGACTRVKAGSAASVADAMRESMPEAAQLCGARLAKVKMPGAWLVGAQCKGADLQESDLSGVMAKSANFDDADLFAADLARGEFEAATFARADLRRASLAGVQAQRASFVAARLCYANLHQARCVGADLSGADLSGARVTEAELADAELRNIVERQTRWFGVRGTQRVCDARAGSAVLLQLGHRDRINCVAFSPDGTTLATAGEDHTARLWDVSSGKLRAALVGHMGPLWHLAFSPNGEILATAGEDHTARLWTVNTGELRCTLTGHEGLVWHLTFGPDGETLATASEDDTARLWEVTSGKLRAILTGHESPVCHVAFSPDGKTLATASGDCSARLWEAASGKLRAILTGHRDWINELAFSPDGTKLATASGDATARLWTVAGGSWSATLTGHEAQIQHLAFSPDGRMLATASGDCTARIWEVASGKLKATLTGHEGPVQHVEFTPDGETLATASGDHTARLWAVASGKLRATLTCHGAGIRHLAFSRDGQTLATAGDEPRARLWEVGSGKLRANLTGPRDWVMRLEFSPDGKTLATASREHLVRLWELASGKLRATLTGQHPQVRHVAFSPDGAAIATAGDDHTAQLWETENGRLRATLTGHKAGVSHLAFSPDGKHLATASDDHTARLWDVTNGDVRATLTGHNAGVWHLAFSPDGECLATASDDHTARLWDVTNGEVRATLTGHNARVWQVAFSPDGDTLATASDDGTARLWEVGKGKPRAILTDHTGRVRHLAFSPDGEMLATTSGASTVRLWDTASGQLRAILSGHDADIWHMAFSPDGRTLATTSDDRTVRLWEVTSGRLRATLTGYEAQVRRLAFSPDGETLATASACGVRLWEMPSGTRSTCDGVSRLRKAAATHADAQRDRPTTDADRIPPHRTLFAHPTLGWLSYDQDGRYRGTPECLELLTYYDPRDPVPSRRLWFANDCPDMRADDDSAPPPSTSAARAPRKPRRSKG